MTAYTPLPEHHSMPLSALTVDVENGSVKIPQFQRDFVWSKQKSADLLDSILKGYPIGTFILWKTKEELRTIRNIGGLDIPKTRKGDYILYVLDGQQRLTSLFAAVKGLKIEREDGEDEDFSEFYVDLQASTDEPVVVTEREGDADRYRWITLNDLLYGKIKRISKYPERALELIQWYRDRLNSYQFPIVTMKDASIEVATEVFTRLNVSGQPLSMFEIMVAKTYDAGREFDLSDKYKELLDDLEDAQYGTLPSAAVLQTVTACITKEVRKKAILGIKKTDFIREWDSVCEAIKLAVEYLRNSIGVPVSQLLPYPAMIVPFAYYFYKAGVNPDATTGLMLHHFFWRVGLGERYSRSLDSHLAQDIKKIEAILKGKSPKYDWEVDTSPEYIESNGFFSAGKAYIKTLLCLLASKNPLSFRDNSAVNVSNDWLARSNSKNYHHFFPKSYLRDNGHEWWYANHIANITLVDDQLNKREIGAKPPSKYVAKFEKTNKELGVALASHFIDLDTFGIRDDNYDRFFKMRCKRLSRALAKKVLADEHA
jgi:hypothetical protein